MFFTPALEKTKVRAEFTMKLFGRISSDVEATAPRRAILGECGDQRIAAGPQGMADLRDVFSSLLRCCQEMKYGTIMPEVVGVFG